MAAALVLWGHALAALLFGGVAIEVARRRPAAWPRRAACAALAVTALWALAIAGIGARDVATQAAEALRNLAWLGCLLLLAGDRSVATARPWPLYVAAAGCAVAAGVLAVALTLPLGRDALWAVGQARLALRLLGALAGLVLVNDAAHSSQVRRTWPLLAAAAAMWSVDFALVASGYLFAVWPTALIVARGFVMTAVAALLMVALQHGGSAMPRLSRTAVVRLLVAAAALTYVALAVEATLLAERLAGAQVRVVQTAIVFGATVALATLVTTPWLRAWTRVKLAKHLFRHRYDYRVEWQRFTAMLGTPGEVELGCRIIQALAGLTDSPGGALLTPDGTGLTVATTWRCDVAGAADAAFTEHLRTTARIVDLDAVRTGSAPAEEVRATPNWLCAEADAWAVVPLFHGSALAGTVLLGRPPVERRLDWEDLDLLRVAGCQAASYLAEDRARHALADAERFDEFNRRFAFILHDIKNTVSGLTLVARNAERHADNSAFRADMIATLQDSAARMTSLLARLSPQHATRAEPAGAVDVGALARRLATARRGQHAIAVNGAGQALGRVASIEQVLGHLLQNAVEATPEGGAPVQVLITANETGVMIEVVDQGIGMTSAFVRDQLFRPFVSSKANGFGLGAHEARELVRAMDGAVEVESREGEGTRFRVRLPAAPALDVAA